MKLHPFQERNVERILALPAPRRLWVLDETGLGKSVTAIVAAQRLQAQRMLVVTKAMVRPSWLERFREWWPGAQVGSITMGRARAKLSKPARERLVAAYSAPIQVCSYDLLPQLQETSWDMIVLDEIHELVSFRSRVSLDLRDLFHACPGATKLGLTATLLSAEPKNVWNLLHMFWPEGWLPPRNTGDPPWRFLSRYCERFENEYGVAYRGVNPQHVHEFATKLRAVSVRTLRSEVRELLPPIECETLIIEASNTRPLWQCVLDWLEISTRESTHVSVFVYHRAQAAEIYDALVAKPRYADTMLQCVTGEISPEHRQLALVRLHKAKRGILIGTMDSLGTGISLTAFQQYLIAEMRSTPGKLVQLLGRFSRLDSKVPSRGFVMLREGVDDETAAKLKRRLADFNALIRAGQGEAVLMDLIDQPDEAAFDRQLDALVAGFVGMGATDDEDADETEGAA